jgi:hypothetical protein
MFVQNMMKFPFPFLPEIYTHLRWDVCFVSYTTKGVEKFGLRKRKLNAVFIILLIFGAFLRLGGQLIAKNDIYFPETRKKNYAADMYIYNIKYKNRHRNTKLNILYVYNTKIKIIFNNS